MLGRRDLLAIKALVGTEHRMSAYADKLQHSTTEWAHTRLPKHATASRPCRSYNQSWLFRGRNRGEQHEYCEVLQFGYSEGGEPLTTSGLAPSVLQATCHVAT